jgi:hypothetical protein
LGLDNSPVGDHNDVCSIVVCQKKKAVHQESLVKDILKKKRIRLRKISAFRAAQILIILSNTLKDSGAGLILSR